VARGQGEPLSQSQRDYRKFRNDRVCIRRLGLGTGGVKTQIGKFKSAELVRALEREIQKEGFIELPISMEHALLAGSLDSPHKDPFDRMLIAQAQVEKIPIVSNDKGFDKFSVRRVW